MVERPEKSNVELKVNSLLLQVQDHDDQLKKLNASKHEHADWLNRHNLEMRELTLRVGEIQATRIGNLEAIVKQMSIKYDAMFALVGSMASDLKFLGWKVSAVTGIFILLAQQGIKYIHF